MNHSVLKMFTKLFLVVYGKNHVSQELLHDIGTGTWHFAELFGEVPNRALDGFAKPNRFISLISSPIRYYIDFNRQGLQNSRIGLRIWSRIPRGIPLRRGYLDETGKSGVVLATPSKYLQNCFQRLLI